MAGLIDFVIPRERKYFDILFSQVEELNKSIQCLSTFSKNDFSNPKNQNKTLSFITKKRDKSLEISKNLITSLHQTFITPIDRTEIKSLSVNLNQAINSIKKICEAIYYYNIDHPDTYFKKQLFLLKKSSLILTTIFKTPLHLKENRPRIQAIKKLETDADDIYKMALQNLSNNGQNPIKLFKNHKLYEETEDAIDKIDHIADIWESVLINHA